VTEGFVKELSSAGLLKSVEVDQPQQQTSPATNTPAFVALGIASAGRTVRASDRLIVRSDSTGWDTRMADLQNEDMVEVIATGKRGRIEATRTDEKQEEIYWVEFDRDSATREWLSGDQLRLIARPKGPDEQSFYPSKSIMGE
jgi:hypothetical protein